MLGFRASLAVAAAIPGVLPVCQQGRAQCPGAVLRLLDGTDGRTHTGSKTLGGGQRDRPRRGRLCAGEVNRRPGLCPRCGCPHQGCSPAVGVCGVPSTERDTRRSLVMDSTTAKHITGVAAAHSWSCPSRPRVASKLLMALSQRLASSSPTQRPIPSWEARAVCER